MENFKTCIIMIKQIKYIMTKQQKKKSLWLFVIVFIGSLLELIGVTALLPFIQSLLNIDSIKSKWYIKPILSAFNPTNMQIVVILGICIMLTYIIKDIFLIWSLNMQYKYRYDFQKELSTRILTAFMKRPYQYFLGINSTEVLQAIEGDVIGAFVIFEYIFKMLSEILMVLLIAIYLIYTDWIMAIGVLTISTLCFITVTLTFKRFLKGIGIQQRNADMLVRKYAYQSVNGIKEINVSRRNNYFINKYNDAYEFKKISEKKAAILGSCPEKIIEAICVSGIIGIVCIRVLMKVDLVLFVPTLSVFAMAAFKILPSISKMIVNITGLIYQRPALEAAYYNLIEVEKFETIKKEYIEQNNTSNIELNFCNELVINNITWKYPDTKTNVLDKLSLTIKRGESIAFIGASGAGKTTLADIILGLFIPLEGSVRVDGVDIFTVPEFWAKTIGYVPQNVYLTDDTIRNNIAFGIEEKIDDDKIWNALEQAQLANFVKKLPDGLNTIVGERGIKFSGGQRQRIAIARALYYDPQILVLDEATSALDNDTESAVMESVDALQKKKTLIIVAHRITTIKNCDRVFEIKDGKAYEVNKQKILEESLKSNLNW